jgi:hypothetical protein
MQTSIKYNDTAIVVVEGHAIAFYVTGRVDELSAQLLTIKGHYRSMITFNRSEPKSATHDIILPSNSQGRFLTCSSKSTKRDYQMYIKLIRFDF